MIALIRLELGCLFVLVVGVAQASDTYKFDGERSTIEFSVHHFIGKTVGKFRRFSGTFELDREAPERSTVFVQIEVKSVDTGINKRDDHLRSAEFFDAAAFPEITFRSRSVKRTGPKSGDIAGDLTMHGKTRPLTLHVTLVGSSGEQPAHWQGTTDPLVRRDFGLLFSSTAEAISGIGQEVAVRIDIEAHP